MSRTPSPKSASQVLCFSILRFLANPSFCCILYSFNGVIKLRSFVIVGGGTGTCPMTLKMYVSSHIALIGPPRFCINLAPPNNLFSEWPLGSSIETTSISRTLTCSSPYKSGLWRKATLTAKSSIPHSTHYPHHIPKHHFHTQLLFNMPRILTLEPSTCLFAE